jgi:hypothetical protein
VQDNRVIDDNSLEKKIDKLILANEKLTNEVKASKTRVINLESKNNITINSLTINLTAYGNEDLSFITDDMIKRIILLVYGSIPKLIEILLMI